MLRRVLLLCSLLTGTQAIAAGMPIAPPAINQSTFSDTFSGGTLDANKWFVDTGHAPGNVAGDPDPEHFWRFSYVGWSGDSIQTAFGLWNLCVGGASGFDFGHASRRG